MRISDWSSDVCSSDLLRHADVLHPPVASWVPEPSARADSPEPSRRLGAEPVHMTGYLLRRLAMTVPTVLLVAVAVFVLVRLIPGDPVALLLGEDADPAQVIGLRQSLRLEEPIPVPEIGR